MKITITYEVDSLAKAHEIITAVEQATKLPYKGYGFGVEGKLQGEDANTVLGVVEETVQITGREIGQVKSNETVDNDSKAMRDSHPTTRPNVSPGEPSIGKIGGQTKADLLEQVNVGILPSAKYQEHMKLLWKRGEVKFDGAKYYL